MSRVLLPLLLLTAGCGGVGTRLDRLPADAARQGYVLVPRPVDLPRGRVSYDCGAESLGGVLGFWNRPADVETLARLLVDPRLQRTDPTRLLKVARDKGLAIEGIPGSVGAIKRLIDAGRPPILMVRLSPGLFHYYVASGYNDRISSVLCEEYDGVKRLFTYEDLESLWQPTDHFLLDLGRSTAADDFDIGAEAEKRRDYARALEYYRRALQMDPAFHEAHTGLGNCLFFTGKPEQARESYEAAHRLNGSDPKLCNNLANVYVHLNVELTQAEHLALRSVESYTAARNRLMGELTRAPEEVEKSVLRRELRELEGELAGAHGTLGQARFALERWALAVAAWQASLDLIPPEETDWRARRHYEIALASRRLGMESEARTHLRLALEGVKDPGLRDAIEQARHP